MAQIFHSSFNTIAKLTVLALVILAAGGGIAVSIISRSAYMTRATVPVEQPVPFSHKHHVNGLGIDCRYCHTTVEQTAFADIPPIETCMSCHSQIWSESPMLEPVRRSYRTGEPLEWTRVHDLPDFVYFDHSIHVNKGIGCVSCHGEVDQMPLTWQVHTLYMEWCLDCHREPERFVRPKDRVFDMEWRPENQLELGTQLVKDYRIRKLTDCYTCHR